MSLIEMMVHMDCAGCGSRLKKALEKLDGVEKVEIDLTMQKVTVVGWEDQEKVLKTARKGGRRAELWPYPYNPQIHNFIRHKNDQNYHHSQSAVNFVASQSTSSYNNGMHGYDGRDYDHFQSSYNNGMHGYDGRDYDHFQEQPYSTVAYDSETSAMFSDENPHACIIM